MGGHSLYFCLLADNYNKIDDMKNAVVAIQRLEGKYLQEWIEHYLSLGFDLVIICDNNKDGDTEDICEIVKDYVDDGKVIIEDYRNRIKAQMQCYCDMYLKYGSEYNILYCDIDEFLVLEKHKSISEFLTSIPSDWECVVFNWMTMTDSGQIYADYSVPVQERFTEANPNAMSQYNFVDDCHVKSLVRSGLDKVQFTGNPHIPSTPLKIFNALGLRCDQSPFQSVIHKVGYIRHYTTKSLEEYCCHKLMRGTGDRSYELFLQTYGNRYFRINDWTKEKQQYLDRIGFKGI